MSPVQARSAQAVTDIMSAARNRFGDVGYEAASIDDIAADAVRTKGSVYHHFTDKQDLFQQVFTAEQRHIASTVAQAGDLLGGVAAYLRTIANAPDSARITLIDAPVVLGWAAWRTCDDGPFRSMLRASLSTHDGLSDHYDLDQLTDLLLGAITEAAIHVASSSNPPLAAASYTAQLQHLLKAVIG